MQKSVATMIVFTDDEGNLVRMNSGTAIGVIIMLLKGNYRLRVQ